jgi:hypothetical protein
MLIFTALAVHIMGVRVLHIHVSVCMASVDSRFQFLHFALHGMPFSA